VAVLEATYRLARDFRACLHIPRASRQRWRARITSRAERYWGEQVDPASVTLAGRAHAGNDATLLAGDVQLREVKRSFWLRWCPLADLAHLLQTAERMRWWRAATPELCDPVADVLDCWEDEHVLVLEGKTGVPLAKWLPAAAASDIERIAAHLGRWLRSYAAGQRPFDADVAGCCGAESRRDPVTRQLRVDARRLVERRLALAENAVRDLLVAGIQVAERWHGGMDAAGIAESLTDDEPAGFIHGDLNLGNVLAGPNEFALVDWWTAPRVSWPLQDVGMLAANLWIVDSAPHRHFWKIFVDAYFCPAPSQAVLDRIDLLGRMMCVGIAARRLARGGWAGRAGRPAALQILDRLARPGTCIGAF
jgi:hypothetical protein